MCIRDRPSRHLSYPKPSWHSAGRPGFCCEVQLRGAPPPFHQVPRARPKPDSGQTDRGRRACAPAALPPVDLRFAQERRLRFRGLNGFRASAASRGPLLPVFLSGQPPPLLAVERGRQDRLVSSPAASQLADPRFALVFQLRTHARKPLDHLTALLRASRLVNPRFARVFRPFSIAHPTRDDPKRYSAPQRLVRLWKRESERPSS